MTLFTMGTLLADPPRSKMIDDLTRSEVRRIARYLSLASELVAGEITQRTFNQTVREWAHPSAGCGSSPILKR